MVKMVDIEFVITIYPIEQRRSYESTVSMTGINFL